MNRLYHYLTLSLFFLFLFPEALSAQWEKPNGLAGLGCNSVAVLGNVLYAATDGNILKSTDNGATWSGINHGRKFEYAQLTVLDTDVFVFNGRTIFRLINGGSEWRYATSGITGPSVNSLFVFDTNLVATSDSGIFISKNRGDNWSKFSLNLPTQKVLSPVVLGQYLFAQGYEGFFVSTNDGVSWDTCEIDVPSLTYISAATSIGDTLLVNFYSGGIYRSTDRGATWASVNSDLSHLMVTALISQDSKVFAGTLDDGIFVSIDRGTSWTPVDSGLESKNIASLVISGSDLYAGGSDGMYRSTDNGLSWDSQISGLKESYIPCLTVSQNYIIHASYSNIYRSTNNGTSWDQIPLDEQSYSITTILTSGNDLFAGTERNGIITSTDNGQTWTQVNSGLTTKHVYSLMISGNIFYAATDSGIFISSDNGNNWSLTNFSTSFLNWNVVKLAVIDTQLFASTYDQGIFRSTDNGASWEQITYGVPYISTVGLVVLGKSLFAATNQGVFRSTDHGTTWKDVSSNIINKYISTLFVYGSNIFASTYTGIYLSTDNGAHWVGVNSGFPYINALSFAISGDYLICGSGGFWRRPLSEMITPTSVRSTSELPNTIRIEPNFPNPFSATTTLSYEVTSSGYLTMRILDISGVTIEAVMSDVFVSEGKHEVTLDGSHLPSGTYFVEIVFRDASGNLSREVQPVTVRK